MEDNKKGFINPAELTPDTYIHYCRLYLIERIYKMCPITSGINYGHVSRLINMMDYKLFRNLNIETNKVILINYLYSLFLSCLEIELPKDVLYTYAEHFASYDPNLNKGR